MPGSPPQAPAVPAQTVQGQGQGTKKGGPQPPKIPTNVSRGTVTNATNTVKDDGRITLDETATFEQNLAKILDKDLIVAQHDREVAIALLQVHLDRAEALDDLPLSMPVASVISDNNGSALKALELSMKAGERLHKAAELLVKAKAADDKALMDILKHKLAEKKLKGEDDGSWGDTTDLPGG